MIVLDTNAWLWWLHDPGKMSQKGRRAVKRAVAAENAIVSVISLWEVALKVRIGKLFLPIDLDSWYTRAIAYPGITMESLSPVDALASTRLPGDFHRDPGDRFIVALARRHGASLITSDSKILDYPHVDTVW